MIMIRFRLGVCLAVLPLVTATLYAQPGSLDASFDPGSGLAGDGHYVRKLALQDDGKVLISGSFLSFNGIARTNLARLNADGSLDTSFLPSSINRTIYFLGPQPNGKVVIVGDFSAVGGQSRKGVARLNEDGSLDPSFNPNIASAAGSVSVFNAAMQSDGKIIIDGVFDTVDGVSSRHHARLNPDGTRDATYTTGTASDGSVGAVFVQNDGKILIGGVFSAFNGISRNDLVRLNTNGTVDLAFNPGSGLIPNDLSTFILAIAAQEDGRLIVGGNFQGVQGVPRAGVARLNTDGSLDPSFGNANLSGGSPNPITTVIAVAVQADGQILVSGNFSAVNGVRRSGIARLNTDGSLDTTFDPGSGLTDGDLYATKFVLQPDGKLVVSGLFTAYNGISRNSVARVHGTPGTNAVISVQPQSQVAIAGTNVMLRVYAGSALPLSYQWFKDGVAMTDATNAVLQLLNVQPANAGAYSVRVVNAVSSSNSRPATVTVVPMIIAAQPTNQLVRAGSNATLRVAAVSTAPLSYQWFFNGLSLSIQTNATLLNTDTQLADDGAYDAVVSNAYGSVTSATARVSVLINPFITQPPLSQTVVEGGNVTLSIGIGGNPAPFLYQWRRGSTVLTNIVLNERTCFFTLSNVQTNQGGPSVTYRVVVTNAALPNLQVNATFNLTVLPDTDRDGLPDSWEIANGLNPSNAMDALLDSDSDGVSNLDEYRSGTDATNALSYIKIDSISVASVGKGEVELHFFAQSNMTYTVQSRATADSGSWHRVADIAARTSSRLETITDHAPPTNGAQRFYRIVAPGAP